MSYQPPPTGYPQYPQYPPYPQKRERPFGVAIIAVLEALDGILYLLIGIFMIVGGIAFASIIMKWINAPITVFGTGMILIGVVGGVLIIFGIIALIMAKGLWDGKGWAWTITLILNIIGLIFGIISLIFTRSGGGIIPLLINVIIIYYLTRPHVKAFFGKGGYVQSPPPPPPPQRGYPQY